MGSDTNCSGLRQTQKRGRRGEIERERKFCYLPVCDDVTRLRLGGIVYMIRPPSSEARPPVSATLQLYSLPRIAFISGSVPRIHLPFLSSEHWKTTRPSVWGLEQIRGNRSRQHSETNTTNCNGIFRSPETCRQRAKFRRSPNYILSSRSPCRRIPDLIHAVRLSMQGPDRRRSRKRRILDRDVRLRRLAALRRQR
ncbi:PREDICTED: uncharacterized protein LOC109175632 [Ipomoea nil]|uniref:uncharacterized protein LOC109175632 n=1 Tax=Ipomoea nil TaxID=35883 RepID=UPI0009017C29|nr:PREDICTED: uncharacterized protein LOC109175632 [Ipomoea nil]